MKTNSNFVKKKLIILVIFCRTAFLQNNSQWLLLDILINATRDIIRLSNVRKSKRKRMSSFNIYIDAFAFLLQLSVK